MEQGREHEGVDDEAEVGRRAHGIGSAQADKAGDFTGQFVGCGGTDDDEQHRHKQ